ncbi:gas vesicle protein K [Streptomyces sp. BPTC-684]|uniref:gas vesicle protein K n=1 Tax=Streptomyces sp. BPTC-684 TaxID=3043734 RepID=UPI0024B25ED9|nr:gas vesicle protein K [Streptomyces sp. BPTC-684]WHM41506.1 gas vesicle protein K [Streptomyces sp. BPTC-684]
MSGWRRVELDADTVERDLARLVLTVVELLRQLMERQALRRVETGELTGEQEERIGLTSMLLEDRMDELRSKFGLRPEDLNIDLGPLGPKVFPDVTDAATAGPHRPGDGKP